jgi:hypothetical protein
VQVLRGQYGPPSRAWVLVTLAGIVLASLGFGLSAWIEGQIGERIASADTVSGQVVLIDYLPLGKYAPPARVHVKYEDHGKAYAASLMAVKSVTTYKIGDEVTLYVDREDPRKVTTHDHFSSEGYLAFLAPALIFFGIVAAAWGPASAVRWRYRYKKSIKSIMTPLQVDFLSIDSISSGASRSVVRMFLRDVAAANESRSSALNLRLICMIRWGAAEESGVVYEKWFYAPRALLTVEAHLLVTEQTDLRGLTLRILDQAINLADQEARDRKIAQELTELRDIYLSLNERAPGGFGKMAP